MRESWSVWICHDESIAQARGKVTGRESSGQLQGRVTSGPACGILGYV
jgi:hypothetical protein